MKIKLFKLDPKLNDLIIIKHTMSKAELVYVEKY